MLKSRLLLVVCVMALAVGVLWAQTGLTDLQRINAALTLIAPIEKQVTSTGVTNYRHIRTRLNTLKTQLLDPNRVEDPITQPPPVPIDCEVSAWVLNTTTWDVCQNGTQTGIQLWERTIVTQPENGGTACGALSENRTVTQTCSSTVQPVLASATVVPSSVVGGADVMLTVTVQQPVQVDTNVVLSSGNTTRAVVPGTVAILAGASSASTTITTLPQTSTSQLGVMITASLPTGDQTAVILLLPGNSPPPPPPPLTEICGDKIDNDGDGLIDEGCAVTQPPPTGSPYFDALAARADVGVALSLRNAAQVEQYRRSKSSPAAVAYLYPNDPDPRKQDAAKVTIWGTRTSLSTQAWLPTGHPGRTNLFVTWDSWHGKEFIGAGISNYKTWQLGSPNEQIWTELRTRLGLGRNGEVGKVDLRQYNGYGPNTVLSPTGPQSGLGYGGVSVGPFTNEFGIMPETWTRHFVYLEYRPTEGWYRFSMWMADVNRNPVLVFDELQIRPRDGAKVITVNGKWDIFRIEFNTSDSNIPAGRGDLVAYVRNFVTLKGLSKSAALSLLQKP